MIKTQLICIEGLGGSGKSSTAQIVSQNLLKKGYNVKKYHEFSKPHPIHDLSFCNIEKWISDTLSNWEKLTNKLATNKDEIVILDSSIIQNSIEDLIAINTDEDIIINYISKIENIIKSLNPCLIYFFQENPRKAIRDIYNQRENDYREKVLNYFASTTFCKSRNLSGYDCVEKFLLYFRELSDKIYDKFGINKISVENTEGKLFKGARKRWGCYFKQISVFLDTELTEEQIKLHEDYSGVYKDIVSKKEIRICSGEDDSLEIINYFPIKKWLTVKGEDRFFIRGKPHEILFKRDKNKVIQFLISRLYTREFESNDVVWEKIK